MDAHLFRHLNQMSYQQQFLNHNQATRQQQQNNTSNRNHYSNRQQQSAAAAAQQQASNNSNSQNQQLRSAANSSSASDQEDRTAQLSSINSSSTNKTTNSSQAAILQSGNSSQHQQQLAKQQMQREHHQQMLLNQQKRLHQQHQQHRQAALQAAHTLASVGPTPLKATPRQGGSQQTASTTAASAAAAAADQLTTSSNSSDHTTLDELHHQLGYSSGSSAHRMVASSGRHHHHSHKSGSRFNHHHPHSASTSLSSSAAAATGGANSAGGRFLLGILFTLAELLLFASVLLWLYWAYQHDDGLAWQGDRKQQFNTHAALMLFGFIFLTGQGMLIHRSFQCCSGIYTKILHTILFVLATSAIGLGLIMSFTAQENVGPSSKPIMHFYSLHAWIGLTTVALFALQFAFGFVSFLILLCCDQATANYRAALLPIHKTFGLIIFSLAIATCFTGLLQTARSRLSSKLNKIDYHELAEPGIVINLIGVCLICLAILMPYIIRNLEIKRPFRSELDRQLNKLSQLDMRI